MFRRITTSCLLLAACVLLAACEQKRGPIPAPVVPAHCRAGTGTPAPRGEACFRACPNRAPCRACCENTFRPGDQRDTCFQLCADSNPSGSAYNFDGETSASEVAAVWAAIHPAVQQQLINAGLVSELERFVLSLTLEASYTLIQDLQSLSSARWKRIRDVARVALPSLQDLLLIEGAEAGLNPQDDYERSQLYWQLFYGFFEGSGLSVRARS